MWPILLLLLFPVAIFSAAAINVKLTRLDLLDQLELHDEKGRIGAGGDGRVDAILAFGTTIYTAKLGIGTPPQPLDFVLNFAGSLPFGQAGSLSFMANLECADKLPCRCKDTFNQTASSTFRLKPDVEFHTKFASGNGVSLGIRINGFYGADRIQFNDDQRPSNGINVLEEWLGQAEHVFGGAAFSRLPFDGMLSLGWQSALVRELAASGRNVQLFLGDQRGTLLIDYPAAGGAGADCRSVDAAAWVPLLDRQQGPLQNDAEPFSFRLNSVMLWGNSGFKYEDNVQRKVVLNPNSPFLQAPARCVAKMAAEMGTPVKVRLGQQKQPFWTIPCNSGHALLKLSIGSYIRILLEKDSLQISLPSGLLPPGQCLWAIQELTDPDTHYWIFGRPLFDQFCVNFNLNARKIAFPRKY